MRSHSQDSLGVFPPKSPLVFLATNITLFNFSVLEKCLKVSSQLLPQTCYLSSASGALALGQRPEPPIGCLSGSLHPQGLTLPSAFAPKLLFLPGPHFKICPIQIQAPGQSPKPQLGCPPPQSNPTAKPSVSTSYPHLGPTLPPAILLQPFPQIPIFSFTPSPAPLFI